LAGKSGRGKTSPSLMHQALFRSVESAILVSSPSNPVPEHPSLSLLPFQMSDAPKSPGGDAEILTKTRTRTERPPLYKVLLLNDDYTPMEFVVHVLERFFGLTHAQAFEIMLTVHKKGLAVVGVFSFEVAETKVAQVMDFTRRHQHPLQCTMEKE
jgi:ATP-dependent Clp protease adaptor protein ClpS